MKNEFIPEAKRYQEAIGKTGKVLLLIDNAPAHPVVDLLNSVDELVTVKFFPPNVTSFIQPMDQGVIRSFKALYRKNLLRELLINDNSSAESVTAFYKRLSLRDCCYMAAASWKSIKQTGPAQNPETQNPDAQNPDSQNPESRNPDTQNTESVMPAKNGEECAINGALRNITNAYSLNSLEL
ncbi:hypothetical protein M514_09488 [Trichuris suis]|uniref:DDE-1 domain-containing protein n=1 Tax=Trichuris suis TaxID=68888 RepID=A0A085NA15_9BILA|nr:hypothetical protein M513_09488 [Trichuris suis]KFD66311.1 hypothetical protein M514_09488 [Trichuris suis]